MFETSTAFFKATQIQRDESDSQSLTYFFVKKYKNKQNCYDVTSLMRPHFEKYIFYITF